MNHNLWKRFITMCCVTALFMTSPGIVVQADEMHAYSIITENDESLKGTDLGEDSSETDRTELKGDVYEEISTSDNDESVTASDEGISADESEAASGMDDSEVEDFTETTESLDNEDETVVGASGALASEQTIPIYRLFNPRTGEHFYTPNTKERDNCIGWGWNFEGIAWFSPKTSSKPVYRVMNPNNHSEHHYTMSVKERDWLVGLGWRNEGIAFYSSETGVPVYRHYHPRQRTGNHHYTTSKGESNHIVKYEGWNYEGVCWKVSKAGGQIDLYNYRYSDIFALKDMIGGMSRGDGDGYIYGKKGCTVAAFWEYVETRATNYIGIFHNIGYSIGGVQIGDSASAADSKIQSLGFRLYQQSTVYGWKKYHKGQEEIGFHWNQSNKVTDVTWGNVSAHT